MQALDVLLIESDPGVIALAHTALVCSSAPPFRLQQADHLEAGLEYLASGGRADVILACLALPDVQGLATLSRLHEHAPDVPIIVLSHDNDDSAAISAVHAGAQDFLIRREIDHTLVSAIRHAIERAQLLAELRVARDELELRVMERTAALQQKMAEVRAGQARLRALSQRLVEVQEAERRHLARELHDEVGQILTGLKLRLELCRRLPPEEAARTLAEAQAGVNELMQRVREMSLNLRPAVLDDLGLLAALKWQSDRYQAQTSIHLTLDAQELLGRRFAAALETAAFRIVQEALTNIARHAGVAEAFVQARLAEEHLILHIRDKGCGFDPEAVLDARASNGVAGMSERALLLGGELHINSSAGAGTTIIATLPLAMNTEP
jgi:signal transduction histidine kinase